jgi:hypothetical protein
MSSALGNFDTMRVAQHLFVCHCRPASQTGVEAKLVDAFDLKAVEVMHRIPVICSALAV